MATYRLVGGPCDGQRSRNFTVRPPIGFDVLCQTHLYSFQADGRFHDAGLDPALADAGVTPVGTHAPRAWANLQRSVNRKLPTSLRRSQVIRRATLRTLARRRRVR